MEKMNSNLEKIITYMTYGSLAILALGLMTSISILALYHILMIIPIIYFLPKTNYRNWSWSVWALAALSVIIILSIILNQDIAFNGYKSLSKVKYFFFGFLSISPLNYYFKNHWEDKKISYLLYVFLIATTFATIVGIYSTHTQFNPVTWRRVAEGRNAGLFGMVMNYAHNLAYFQIIVTGLVFYREKVKNFINLNFLYIVFAINLAGLYLSYTRGAWLGFLGALPFFLLKNNKKRFVALMLGLILVGGLAYTVAGKNVVRPQSDYERVSQWKAAIMAFRERPLLGYGYLNFEHYSVEIKRRYNIGELQFGGHAHGNPFEMLGSAGILGFFAFMSWVFFWFTEMYKRNDIVAGITLPFIIVFFIGGLTQSTISLGINLFFVMAVYSLSQVKTVEK